MTDKDTITLPREVIVQAVKVLSPMAYDTWPRERNEVVATLRAALAAPRPEPVAYFDLQKQVFYWAKPTMIDVPMTVALKPLPLYAAPLAAAPEPEPEPEKRHPGYIIGNHWLETAYERLCAGEAEDAILEDYELVREPRLRALRRNAERYRGLRNRACHGPHERFVSEYGWFDVSGQHEPGFDAAVDAALEASTAPAAAAVDASTAPEAKQ